MPALYRMKREIMAMKLTKMLKKKITVVRFKRKLASHNIADYQLGVLSLQNDKTHE